MASGSMPGSSHTRPRMGSVSSSEGRRRSRLHSPAHHASESLPLSVPENAAVTSNELGAPWDSSVLAGNGSTTDDAPSLPSLGSSPNALQTWIAQAAEAPPPQSPPAPPPSDLLPVSEQPLRRLARKPNLHSQSDPRSAREIRTHVHSASSPIEGYEELQDVGSVASASAAGSQRSRRRRRKVSKHGELAPRVHKSKSTPSGRMSMNLDPLASNRPFAPDLQSSDLALLKSSSSDATRGDDKPLSGTASQKHLKSSSFALAPPTQRWVVPIKNWARWMSRMDLGWYILPCTVLGSLAIKFAVGLWGWSGRSVPPRFGDFEAQRHWVELTLHKPYSEWYFYDLEWWGLDYPPLTAWVSLWFGKLAARAPSVAPHFALDTSRGDESDPLVAFMRFSVVLCDLLIYIPAVVFFCYARRLRDRPYSTSNSALGGTRNLGHLNSNQVIKGVSAAAVLAQPALMLIDHGHFQYNGVMLGLSTWTFAFLYSFLPNHASSTTFFDSAGNAVDVTSTPSLQTAFRSLYTRKISYQYLVAAVTFTLALLFKQMALFFAPAVFAVMLGRCVGLYFTVGFDPAFALFCGLGMAVIIPTLLSLAPWILTGDLSGILQMIYRVFPVARGVFEDKVANVWCFLSVFPLLPQSLRFKNIFAPAVLARMAVSTTLLLILPTCAVLFLASVLTVKIETEMDTQAVEAATNPAPPPPRSRYTGSIGQRSMRSRASRRTMALPSIAGSEHDRTIKREDGSVAGDSVSGRVPLVNPRLHTAPSTSRLFPSTYPKDPSEWSAPVFKRVSSSPSPVAAVLPWAVAHVALTAFLFGFQVHEKTILIPLLPVVLCLTSPDDTWAAGGAANEAEWGLLFNNVAAFSMYPLLQRDGLTFPYFLTLLGWNWMLGLSPRTYVRRCLALAQDLTGLTPNKDVVRTEIHLSWTQRFSTLAHTGMLAIHALSWILPRIGHLVVPGLTQRLGERYPDLEAVAMVVLVTPILGVIWLVLFWKTLTVAASSGVYLPYVNSTTSVGPMASLDAGASTSSQAHGSSSPLVPPPPAESVSNNPVRP